MADWRTILGFAVDEDPDFAEVHDRYRKLMTEQDLDPQRVLEISAAVTEARKQLGTSRRHS